MGLIADDPKSFSLLMHSFPVEKAGSHNMQIQDKVHGKILILLIFPF
jgi:hypothetical protein